MTHQGRSSQQRQPDQRRADQRLVGDRVGQLAELGHQAALAGQFAVEAVGDRGDRERPPRPRPASRSRGRRRGTARRGTPAPARAGTRSARWRCSTPTPGPGAIGDRVRLVGLQVEARRRPHHAGPVALGDEVDALAVDDDGGHEPAALAPGRPVSRVDPVGLRALVQRAADGAVAVRVVAGVLDEHLDRRRRCGPRRAGPSARRPAR